MQTTSTAVQLVAALYKDDPKNPAAEPYINVVVSRAADKNNELYQKVAQLWHDPEVQQAHAQVTKNTAVEVERTGRHHRGLRHAHHRGAGGRGAPHPPGYRHGVPAVQSVPIADGRRQYRVSAEGRGLEARRKARVEELLEFVGLAEKARSYPDQLSGGQQQRVGIARALATSPSLLLADESTSALDPETTGEVLRLLQKINRELGITIVVITHEMDVIRAVADRVAVLAEGKIVELASTFEVFASPQAPPTRSFVETVLHTGPMPRSCGASASCTAGGWSPWTSMTYAGSARH